VAVVRAVAVGATMAVGAVAVGATAVVGAVAVGVARAAAARAAAVRVAVARARAAGAGGGAAGAGGGAGGRGERERKKKRDGGGLPAVTGYEIRVATVRPTRARPSRPPDRVIAHKMQTMDALGGRRREMAALLGRWAESRNRSRKKGNWRLPVTSRKKNRPPSPRTPMRLTRGAEEERAIRH